MTGIGSKPSLPELIEGFLLGMLQLEELLAKGYLGGLSIHENVGQIVGAPFPASPRPGARPGRVRRSSPPRGLRLSAGAPRSQHVPAGSVRRPSGPGLAGPLARWHVPCRTVAWALLWSIPVGVGALRGWPAEPFIGIAAAWLIACIVLVWRLAKGSQEAHLYGAEAGRGMGANGPPGSSMTTTSPLLPRRSPSGPVS